MNLNTQAVQANDNGWWLSWYQDPPKTTREKILFSAFQEVHLNGFQSASIQNIINSAGITKGALYHYFSSKDEIGYALIDEIFSKYVYSTLIKPLETTTDPITTLMNHLKESGAKMKDEDIALGCPLDHISQEMAPLDNIFQEKIQALYQAKHRAVVDAFVRGQEAGTVIKEVSPESVAMMINATLHGCMAMAKTARSLDMLMKCASGLFEYLEQLRPK
jgi:TetR/AcrR family transcriptional repressor of nem operon